MRMQRSGPQREDRGELGSAPGVIREIRTDAADSRYYARAVLSAPTHTGLDHAITGRPRTLFC